MKISSAAFLQKYNQLRTSQAPGIELFAHWKMKYLIETGEAFCIPERDCYYMIRNNHLLAYHSPDNRLHLSTQELNSLDCISLPASMYDTVKEHLTGFAVSRGWNLRYDFAYQPQEQNPSRYEAVDFDFSDRSCYAKAAQIINAGEDWLGDKNIEKMTTYAAFDPSLWFFMKDIATQDIAAVSISTYCADAKQTDLDWIYVAQEFHGKGCGRFLIAETIQRCKDKSESICVSGAAGFYRKCGFVDHEQWAWAAKEGYRFKAAGIQPH